MSWTTAVVAIVLFCLLLAYGVPSVVRSIGWRFDSLCTGPAVPYCACVLCGGDVHRPEKLVWWPIEGTRKCYRCGYNRYAVEYARPLIGGLGVSWTGLRLQSGGQIEEGEVASPQTWN